MRNGSTNSTPIIVYTKPGCAGCVMLKEKLIADDAFFIEKSATHNMELLMQHGVRSLPAVTIDNECFYTLCDMPEIENMIGGQMNE